MDHISLVFIRYFFSQTQVVFKFDLVMTGTLDNFHHNLFICLPFDNHLLFHLSWSSFNASIHFLIKTSNLMRDSMFFCLLKVESLAKITPDVTDSLWFLYVMQNLGNSFRDVFRTLSNNKGGAFCKNS